MEFHGIRGIPLTSGIPLNSVEFHGIPQKKHLTDFFMKFLHGIPCEFSH
jgi:hypothetical protein